MRQILDSEADPKLKKLYNDLKLGFDLPTVPLFFTYIGAYPEYLDYITGQIVKNLEDKKFQSLSQELSTGIQTIMQDLFKPSSVLQNWTEKYKYTPSFYYFNQDLEKNYLTNVKLALIFIALREAVKGWAIAAKRLPNINKERPYTSPSITEEKIIYEGEIYLHSSPTDHTGSLSATNQSLIRPQTELQKNLLGEYLGICQQVFSEIIKTEKCLLIRVQLEKLLLNSLPLFSGLIVSPINIVLELTSKYPDFPDLLYLLSQHFPTYAMQRMMFSEFMLQNSK